MTVRWWPLLADMFVSQCPVAKEGDRYEYADVSSSCYNPGNHTVKI